MSSPLNLKSNYLCFLHPEHLFFRCAWNDDLHEMRAVAFKPPQLLGRTGFHHLFEMQWNHSACTDFVIAEITNVLAGRVGGYAHVQYTGHIASDFIVVVFEQVGAVHE